MHLYICLGPYSNIFFKPTKNTDLQPPLAQFDFPWFPIKAGFAGGYLINKASHVNKLIY